jgi:hypothetical protein
MRVLIKPALDYFGHGRAQRDLALMLVCGAATNLMSPSAAETCGNIRQLLPSPVAVAGQRITRLDISSPTQANGTGANARIRILSFVSSGMEDAAIRVNRIESKRNLRESYVDQHRFDAGAIWSPPIGWVVI